MAIRACGREPVWLYDDQVIEYTDMEGRKLFPVYDCLMDDPPGRSILVIDAVDRIPAKARKEALTVAFPAPSASELENIRLCGGKNIIAHNFAELEHAELAWEVAGVRWSKEGVERATWEGFKAGGEPPVDDTLLGYYAAYHLKPEEDDWNYVLWLRRHVPATIYVMTFEAIRLEWPQNGVPRFPLLLKVKKVDVSRAKTARSQPVIGKSQGPVEKAYSVDW